MCFVCNLRSLLVFVGRFFYKLARWLSGNSQCFGRYFVDYRNMLISYFSYEPIGHMPTYFWLWNCTSELK